MRARLLRPLLAYVCFVLSGCATSGAGSGGPGPAPRTPPSPSSAKAFDPSLDPFGRPWRLPGAPCGDERACRTSCAERREPLACAWLLSEKAAPTLARCLHRGADVPSCTDIVKEARKDLSAEANQTVVLTAMPRMRALCAAGTHDACKAYALTYLSLPAALRVADEDDTLLLERCNTDPALCDDPRIEVPPAEADLACAEGWGVGCAAALRQGSAPHRLKGATQACAENSSAACAALALAQRTAPGPALRKACEKGNEAACVAWAQEKPPLATHPAAKLLEESCSLGRPSACAALFGGKAFPKGAAARPLLRGSVQACGAGSSWSCHFALAVLDAVRAAGDRSAYPQGAESQAVAVQCARGHEDACIILGELDKLEAHRTSWSDGCSAGSAVACGNLTQLGSAAERKSALNRGCGLAWFEPCETLAAEQRVLAYLEACHQGDAAGCGHFARAHGAALMKSGAAGKAMDVAVSISVREGSLGKRRSAPPAKR